MDKLVKKIIMSEVNPYWKIEGVSDEFYVTNSEEASFEQLQVIQEALKKLYKYEQIEEKGLLFKLPYKLGDIVYSYEERTEGEYEIVEYEIYSISIDGKNMFTFYAEATDGYEEIEFSSNDIGISVFDTIKDAEKALN